jgi:phospholipid transport system substrate-binding protein
MKILSFVLLVLGLSTAVAGPAADHVKTKYTAVSKLLDKPAKPNDARIDAAIDGLFDYDVMVDGMLVRVATPPSAVQRKELTDLVKQLLRIAFQKQVKNTDGYKLELEEHEDKAKALVVRATFNNPKQVREPPVMLRFKMAQKDGAWRAVDLVVEGSSTVKNYNDQIVVLLRKPDGFAELVKKMKQKIARQDDGPIN